MEVDVQYSEVFKKVAWNTDLGASLDRSKTWIDRCSLFMFLMKVGYLVVGPPRPVLEFVAARGFVGATTEAIDGALKYIGHDPRIRLRRQKVLMLIRAYRDEWRWTDVATGARFAACWGSECRKV
jgi:hypothetical protein